MCASLSHTHYWYEVGILKVPAYDNIALLVAPTISPQSLPNSISGKESCTTIQTLRFAHRLDLNLIGVLDGMIAKL